MPFVTHYPSITGPLPLCSLPFAPRRLCAPTDEANKAAAFTTSDKREKAMTQAGATDQTTIFFEGGYLKQTKRINCSGAALERPPRVLSI